ncbi:stage V sporulation protein AE [Clostridiales bacterium PH28_bin88]|nr:stage V sporulation protein AE [Clostridiales bacterium PH28_bin88]
MTAEKRKVVLITDGDRVAKKAVEQVARKIGGRCVSLSAGNPTPITGEKIVELIMQAPRDPVLVMLDDRGKRYKGPGERALEYIARHPGIEVLGVVAVASNTDRIQGTEVEESITKDGQAVHGAVDKYGNPKLGNTSLLGDTVDVLNDLHIPIVIGTGDTGKMDGKDSLRKGVPITTRAVEEILLRSGFKYGHH